MKSQKVIRFDERKQKSTVLVEELNQIKLNDHSSKMKITWFIFFLAFSRRQIHANTTNSTEITQTKLNSNETNEDKVQKRGLFELSNDKFHESYYQNDFPSNLPITDPPPQPTPPITFTTFPSELIITTTPVPLLQPSGDLINLGHSTHVEKTITVYKGVPQPYAVIKHVHVPVKVPVAVPVPVEKTVHVPVKVPVPQPYTVVKEVHVPVKVFVDNPYPVYLHHEGFYQYNHEHGHQGFFDRDILKPIPVSGLEKEHIDWSLKLPPSFDSLEKAPLNCYYKLPDDLPQFLTQSNDHEKLVSASNKVETNLSKKGNSIESKTTNRNSQTNQSRGNKRSHRDQKENNYDYNNYNYHYKPSNRDRNQRGHRLINAKEDGQHKDELFLHTSF